MKRLLMLVEGLSERGFVKQTLAPHLEQHGVYVEQPSVIWTKRIPSGGGFPGGVSNWSQIRRSLLPLTHDSDAWITTLLDFYGLPEDFPGYLDARAERNPRDGVKALQERFAKEIGHRRFIPFFALHEFETWLFSAPDVIAAHFDKPELAEGLRRVVQEAGEPESINHGTNTHPKERLKGMFSYRETSHGPILMQKIGIPAIRAACPHFSNWLTQLEQLGETAK